jgi:hypothetical protein
MQIASLGDQKEKTAAYKALLDSSLASRDDLEAIVTHCTSSYTR